jgi:hypothetical protein
VNFTTTKSYTSVKVEMKFSKENGRIWIDEVNLSRTSPVTNLLRVLLQNKSFEVANKADFFDLSGRLTIRELPSPGFSTKHSNIWNFQGAAVEDIRVCDTAHSGDCSFSFVGDGTNKILTQWIPMSGGPGESLTLSNPETFAQRGHTWLGVY